MERNPPKDSTLINVCIIPSDYVGNECVKISQSLKSDGTMFVLDGKNKFAHMTVYMVRFPREKVQDVLKAVERAISKVTRFQCEHRGYFMTKGRYFEASYQKSSQLLTLHGQIIQALAGHRLNPGNPFEEGYFTPYTHEQQKNAQETGYDLAHNLYRPHITLTRYHEGQVPERDLEVAPVNLSFMLEKICVYEADGNGAVFKRLAEFIV